jgi:hypothetical protein
MSYYRGKILKRISLPNSECVDIVARKDGNFQFILRAPCEDGNSSAKFESAAYVSAEAAEAAARLKFKL